ncbi:MAG TPA: ribonuclease P protein component [Bacteroidales bacterium]|nr:ribonuclease P protein component [Bacteroidales bacterium]
MLKEAFLPPTSDFKLRKSERLCSKKAFEFLFTNGKTAFSHPIKLIYKVEKATLGATIQVAFGASKRNFKRAVKRNRIKRLLREAYRLHKIAHKEGMNEYYMFLYIGKEIVPLETIKNSITKVINQASKKDEKDS